MINNGNFFGEINGRNIYSFLAELDYDLTSSTERIEHLKKVLYTEQGYPHPFFERLFEQTHDADTGLNTSYVKLVLHTTDTLYTDTNVCDVLRKMTDYVLFTKEAKALEKSNKVEYKIYKDARLFEKIQKELSLEGELDRMKGSVEDGDADVDGLIHILVKEANCNKDKATKIVPSDFQDEEMGSILKAYQWQINNMRERLDHNKSTILLLDNCYEVWNEEVKEALSHMGVEVRSLSDVRDHKIKLLRDCKMLSKHIHSMRQDMLDVKEMIKRPIVFKHIMSGSTEPDLSPLDVIFEPEVLNVEEYREKAIEHMQFYRNLINQYKKTVQENKSSEKTYYGYVKKIEFFESLFKEVEKIAEAKTENDVLKIRDKQYINTVKELMVAPEKDVYDLQDDMEMILFIVNEAVKKVKMSKIEKDLLNLFRLGVEQEDIAKIISEKYEVEMYGMRVYRDLIGIAKKVYKELQDTYIEHGINKGFICVATKVCVSCGKEKMTKEFHKDSKSADGLRKECKKCRNK